MKKPLLIRPETISVGNCYVDRVYVYTCTVTEYDYTGGRVFFRINGTVNWEEILDFCRRWRSVPPPERFNWEDPFGIVTQTAEPPEPVLWGETLAEYTDRAEAAYIEKVVGSTAPGPYRLPRAARQLGVSLPTLYRRIEKLCPNLKCASQKITISSCAQADLAANTSTGLLTCSQSTNSELTMATPTACA